jgi:hypothetical protein
MRNFEVFSEFPADYTAERADTAEPDRAIGTWRKHRTFVQSPSQALSRCAA